MKENRVSSAEKNLAEKSVERVPTGVFLESEARFLRGNFGEKTDRRSFLRTGAMLLSSALASGCVTSEAFRRISGATEQQMVERSENLNPEELEKFRLGVEKLQEYLEQHKVDETIKRSREYFNSGVDGFFTFHHIEASAQFVKSMAEVLKTNPNLFVSRNRFQEYKDSLKKAEAAWYPMSPEDRARHVERSFSVSGFDASKTVTDEQVTEALRKHYPASLLNASTFQVIYSDLEDEPNEEKAKRYGFKAQLQASSIPPNNAELANIRSILTDDPPESVRGYIIMFPFHEQGLDFVMNTLHHEFGHRNDWISSPLLSNVDRLAFLRSVTGLYVTQMEKRALGYKTFGPPREIPFKSDYVDVINSEDEDTRRYMKVSEYWAEIFKQYQNDKEKFSAEFPEEARVVKKWIDIITGTVSENKVLPEALQKLRSRK
ncbi:MAG: hypothetical protein WCJ29_05775 [bacterium]